jgi:predicted RNA-binding Zn-ribbon protein involved in translation (DUF1610 family)
MGTDDLACPKCGGAMIRGFLVDRSHGANVVPTWVEGAPEASFWQITKAPAAKSIPVGTYRCSACGFLESYAGHQFATQ